MKNVESFLNRMNNGKEYEKNFKQILETNNIKFQSQKFYNTSLGKYIADFVLNNNIIIETTLANLDLCAKHPFISRKIKKINELTELGENITIVTPFIQSWKQYVKCNVINDNEFYKLFINF